MVNARDGCDEGASCHQVGSALSNEILVHGKIVIKLCHWLNYIVMKVDCDEIGL